MEKSILDDFLKKLVERTKKIRVGDPMNPDTQMGALISEEHLHKVLEYVRIGREQVQCPSMRPLTTLLLLGEWLKQVNSTRTLWGGGGGSLFWPKWIRVFAAEQGMVCRVLFFKQCVQFHHLVSFPTGSF